ncbi:MAG: SDR family oxidoreductase [Bacteroidetes bacterium]|nr:MAG: SDR family oxidoreductase [Bacteroidota bacterium]
MKILVIGSTGRVGMRLVEYSLDKGHEVTAFARQIDDYPVRHPRLSLVTGDVLYPALIEAAMPGHDIVLSVIGLRQFSGPITLLSTGLRNIIHVMKKTGPRRLVTVTGAGILQENRDELIMDSISFPPNLQNLSMDHLRMYEALRESDLDWTVVCPSFMFGGKRTGTYQVEADYFPRGVQNRVSVEDVADFITREMTENTFIRKRVGIAWPKGMEVEEED